MFGGEMELKKVRLKKSTDETEKKIIKIERVYGCAEISGRITDLRKFKKKGRFVLATKRFSAIL